MDTSNINDEVAAAMRLARSIAKMTAAQFARELNRLVPEHHLDAADIAAFENSQANVLGNHLVAAARIAQQPTSSILDELDLYEATLPRLEARIAELERRAEASKH